MAVKVEKELGPVEILVNNASLMPMTSTPHLKSDEIDTILQLNLGSYIMVGNALQLMCVPTMYLSFLSQTTKEFLPKMITRKSGHLVAINALAGGFCPGFQGIFYLVLTGFLFRAHSVAGCRHLHGHKVRNYGLYGVAARRAASLGLRLCANHSRQCLYDEDQWRLAAAQRCGVCYFAKNWYKLRENYNMYLFSLYTAYQVAIQDFPHHM